jgi:hypothetical protein
MYELIKTEAEYVQDLQTLKSLYISSLLRSDIIPKFRREDFINVVFGNLDEIISLSSNFCDQLHIRKKENYVISSIGDIFESWSLQLNAYFVYGSNQILSKYFLDRENRSNLFFLKFCEVH